MILGAIAIDLVKIKSMGKIKRIRYGLACVVSVGLISIVFQNCAKPIDSNGNYELGSSVPNLGTGSTDPLAVGATPTPVLLPSGSTGVGTTPTPSVVAFKNEWLAVGSSGLTSPSRFGHSAVWTGTKMLIFGGYDGNVRKEVANGAAYDPKTNTWEPISASNAPLARAFHVGVWTGTKMIIWGGTTYGSSTRTSFGDGAIYDPATDTWKKISTTGAPSARTSMFYAWTGTKLLIFGGSRSTQVLGDGFLYDPNTDVWTKMNGTGAPSARSNSASYGDAQTSSTKLMVFGGFTASSGVLADAYVYDSLNDSWKKVSATGFPANRSNFAYSFNGVRFFLFGGNNATSTQLGTGAIYDVATDSWKAMSATGAPSPRFVLSGVTAGNKFILYGGQLPGAAGFADNGGIYDAVADTWTAINPIGNPGGFSGHTSIWTGDAMIIMGNHSNPSAAILH